MIPDLDDRFFHPPDVPAELQTAMAKVDVPALVSKIAEGGTLLQIVVLSLSTREQSVWSISRDEGRPVLQRMDTYSGRLVVEREERG